MEKLNQYLERGDRIFQQKREDKNKVYSMHAPEVECISKGKAQRNAQETASEKIGDQARDRPPQTRSQDGTKLFDGNRRRQDQRDAGRMWIQLEKTPASFLLSHFSRAGGWWLERDSTRTGARLINSAGIKATLIKKLGFSGATI